MSTVRRAAAVVSLRIDVAWTDGVFSRPHATIRTNPTTVSLMLVARELTKEYQSGPRTLTVLDAVSFDIPQGTFVSIVGPSGSGKTTLLGLLAGLDTPTSGSVILD